MLGLASPAADSTKKTDQSAAADFPPQSMITIDYAAREISEIMWVCGIENYKKAPSDKLNIIFTFLTSLLILLFQDSGSHFLQAQHL